MNQISSHQRNPFPYKQSLFYRSLMLCTTFLGLLVLFHINSPIAGATSMTGDPLVIIAVDVTSKYGPCTETFRSNIGTPRESVTYLLCPAGTIIARETIRRSQAIAEHETYVIYPSSQAPTSVLLQTRRQFQQIVENKRIMLRQKGKRESASPQTGCGQTGSRSENWYPYGGSTHYYSTITYYRTSDCSKVSFDTSTIQVINPGPSRNPPDGYWPQWTYDLYAGNSYGVPNCPALSYKGTFSHGVGQIAPVGYGYEQWVGSPDSCWFAEPDFDSYLYPIN